MAEREQLIKRGRLAAGETAQLSAIDAPSSVGGERGASEARARVEGLLASSMTLETIHANARRSPDLYAQVYAIAAPQFTAEAHRIASEIGMNTPSEIRSSVVALAFDAMQEAISAAVTVTAGNPHTDAHPLTD